MLVNDIAAIPTSEATALEVRSWEQGCGLAVPDHDVNPAAAFSFCQLSSVSSVCDVARVNRQSSSPKGSPGMHFGSPCHAPLVPPLLTLIVPPTLAPQVAKNIFAKVYQGAGSRLHVTAYCGALEVLRETAVRRLPVELTAWFTQLPEDGKFHKDVGEWLGGRWERRGRVGRGWRRRPGCSGAGSSQR